MAANVLPLMFVLFWISGSGSRSNVVHCGSCCLAYKCKSKTFTFL